MKKFHSVENISCNAGKLSLVIDGKPFEFSLEKTSKALASASTKQLENFEVSSSGYGIHWPLIDEDISIAGLLEIASKDFGEKLLQSVREMKAGKSARRPQ